MEPDQQLSGQENEGAAQQGAAVPGSHEDPNLPPAQEAPQRAEHMAAAEEEVTVRGQGLLPGWGTKRIALCS